MWYETFYVEPKLDKNEINNIKKLFNPTKNVIEEYSLTDRPVFLQYYPGRRQ